MDVIADQSFEFEEVREKDFLKSNIDKQIDKINLLVISNCEWTKKDTGDIISSSDRFRIAEEREKKHSLWRTVKEIADRRLDLPVIAYGSKDFVDFIREDEDIYYRFFAHHIYLEPTCVAEITRMFFEEMEMDGFTLTDAFHREICTYINTVYPKADLKGREFVKDLVNRVLVSYYLSPEGGVIGKRCVPFYHKIKSFEEIISRMDQLVGLEKVKEQFHELYRMGRDVAGDNKTRLHFAFVGNPGTGKSTVAALTADLLFSMGLIKKNKIVTVTSADIIGMYLGQWVDRLKIKIAEAQGGVLFIDEAYFLIPGNENAGVQQSQCISVLIQEMENNSDNITVIFAGYEAEINRLFRANDGLRSRVPFFFHFEDYTDEELMQIFLNLASKENLSLDEGAYDAMMSRFALERAEENFGNARAVANIYQQVKSVWMEREAEERIFLEEDVRKTMPVPLNTDLDDMIGLETVKEELKRFESRVKYLKYLEDNRIFAPSSNMHMMFSGNPGTGKTTVAKKIADCLYHIGILKTNKLVAVERKDLVDVSVGGTALKTEKVIQRALNGVLFIDEAYSLYKPDNPRDTGPEAITVLITAMEEHKKDLIVIFAGYEREMMEFQKVNAGISSRIGFKFYFPDYTPEELTQMFFRKMTKSGFVIGDGVSDSVYALMKYFSAMENFGNGRFVDQVIDFTINKRAMRPYIQRGNDISQADIPTPKDLSQVLAGVQAFRFRNVRSEEKEKRIAVHEAGHALVSVILSPEREIKMLSVEENAVSGGTTSISIESQGMLTEKFLKADLAVCFGGRNAERLIFGDNDAGAAHDIYRARENARIMVELWGMGEFGVTTPMDFLREADRTATRVLTEHRDMLERISEELRKRKNISGEELVELINEERDGSVSV
ncbi:MAG: AAA family ATPase [Clostridiales bacterium]|nr:AAA family ATPase [Clostridiales bacterium]